jgi:hypothetical protein|tara:strand:- start:644 stop:850 length:207 start_codon:yes stop_codon:yes gene_type:complete
MKPAKFRLRLAGYEMIRETSQGYHIYAKGNWRALYDSTTDTDRVRFMDEIKYFPKRGLSQVIFNGRRK